MILAGSDSNARDCLECAARLSREIDKWEAVVWATFVPHEVFCTEVGQDFQTLTPAGRVHPLVFAVDLGS